MSKQDENSLAEENADALDKFHCFGSRWFCLQMQEAFNVQSAILREIAQKNLNNPKIKPALPLIHGLHTTSEAISLLRRDGLLNEAHVLMRLLTERALNLCYLLVAPPDDSPGMQRASANKTPPRAEGPLAEQLVEFAKGFRFKETYDSEALEKKISVIAANTKIPLDFLRLIVSSHYPQASLALSGSASGAVFHLLNMTEDEEEHSSSNFATLLFGGLTLLNYVIRVLAAHGIPEELIKDSDTSHEAATKLRVKIRHPAAPDVQDTYGWWQSLSDHENLAGKRLAPLLREFDIAFGACVEAGMLLPVLAKQDKGSLRLRLCALYLKRMLNDVRSVWVMIRQGSTSQAGSIAASLFENALLIQCLAENEARAAKFSKAPPDRWPWSKRGMCDLADQDRAKREKNKPDPKAAAAHYKQYCWLCEIKHASLGYVAHDSGSTQFREKGYAIMPFPDIREEDWPVKRKILLISLHNAKMAMQAFARAGSVKETGEREMNFASRIKTMHDIVVKSLQDDRGA
jgi:hypothetical protein